MRKYYDDFIKLPKSKMAQEMEDMTFLYHETRVPKAHYQKILDKHFEEIMEAQTSLILVNAVYGTLEQLKKENEKIFVQALLCIEFGVKPNSLKANELRALELTYANVVGNKGKLLDKKYEEVYIGMRDNSNLK